MGMYQHTATVTNSNIFQYKYRQPGLICQADAKNPQG